MADDNSEKILKALEKLCDMSKKGNSALIKASGSNADVARAKSFFDSYGGGLIPNDKYTVKAFNSMKKRLDSERNLNLISEEEYYKNLASLRDSYFAVGTEGWHKYTAEIYKHNRELSEKQQKELEKQLENQRKAAESAYNDIVDFADKKIGAVIKKQQSLSENFSSFGPLFNNGTIRAGGETIKFYSGLADIEKQTADMTKYAERLRWLKDKLAKSGIGENAAASFFDNIISRSATDGDKTFYALEHADEGKLFDYFRAYEQNLALADAYSKEFTSDDMDEALGDTAEYMKQRLTEAGFEIPEEFFASGTLSAQNFGEGFSTRLDAELEKIKERIESFNASLAVTGQTAGGVSYDNSVKNIYNNTYSINGEGTEQLYSKIKRYDTFKRLAGM
mgnify:CR=1 FL=1